MIVCSCEAVSDRVLKRSIDQGCRTPAELSRATRAGTRCGSCRGDLERMCGERRRESEALSAK